jgi:4-diphosphocytidyl-2-C-methyl-D-erythritol kinase
MAGDFRRARVRALAKINLSLEVLNRREDGYHNLRTVFQTISLADGLDLDYTPDAERRVRLDCTVDIADNLAVRAAEAILDATNARGSLGMRLRKRIPLGSGLGGGSSDAAAVLLALPALAGRVVPIDVLFEIAAKIGSDVPFFLAGGTALGLGRGTEIYPLADAHAGAVAVIVPDAHVSTAEAYTALGRTLTWTAASPTMGISQALALSIGAGLSAGSWSEFCRNDFESVIFRRHPELGAIKTRLKRAGADAALLTGSGAAVFGIFRSPESIRQAEQNVLRKDRVLQVSFLSRSRYRALWWRQLAEHIEPGTWPPRSRYAR